MPGASAPSAAAARGAAEATAPESHAVALVTACVATTRYAARAAPGAQVNVCAAFDAGSAYTAPCGPAPEKSEPSTRIRDGASAAACSAAACSGDVNDL